MDLCLIKRLGKKLYTMKEIKSSPLYSYDEKTHTFSFNKKNVKKQKRVNPIAFAAIGIIASILVVCIIQSVVNPYRFSIKNIPEYSGSPYVVINNNVPFFEEKDAQLEEFEKYSNLDRLGRCGEAFANLSEDMMPDSEREPINSVTPSGWINKEYDFIDGGYLYNRCHLIAFQLTGQNANEKNLITGTRYFNVEGMLPFENKVANYLWLSHNHVLYRVTPIFKGRNLVASGVEIEAYSVEDNGDNICFNVFVYNVQPEILINYRTGESKEK